MSNHVQNTLDAINKIDVEVDSAQEAVMESYVELGNKFDTMEKHGLPVASDDSTIQSFIDNRNEIITEYTNEGKKKANIKVIGICNWLLPQFKKLDDALDKGTIQNTEVDRASTGPLGMLAMFFSGSWAGVSNMQKNVPVGQMSSFALKSFQKQIEKIKKSGEYSDEEIHTLDNAKNALEGWKTAAKMDKAERTFFDKFIAYTRDVRTMSRIKSATKDVIEKLEAAKKMAESHYNGKEETNNG